MTLITHLTPKTSSQEMFDYVTVFLMRQGQVSQKSKACLYRGPNGLMCAAGCVIPDQFYRKPMEGEPISGIIINSVDRGGEKKFWKALDRHISLLVALQGKHDVVSHSSRAPARLRKFWLNEFREVAIDHQLVFNEDLYKEWL